MICGQARRRCVHTMVYRIVAGGELYGIQQRHYGRYVYPYVRRRAVDVESRVAKQRKFNGGIYVDTKGKSNTADTQTAIFAYDDLNCVWTHRAWGHSGES